MRGLATAGPRFVSGLPRSRGGTSVTGPIVDHEGSPPCAAPGHARPWSSVDAVVLLPPISSATRPTTAAGRRAVAGKPGGGGRGSGLRPLPAAVTGLALARA